MSEEQSLIGQLCMTFDSLQGSHNMQVRGDAENYLKSIQSADGMGSSLLYIATHLEEANKDRQTDVATQAALFLKLKVQQCWGEDVGKENIDSVNRTDLQYAYPFSPNDKHFLRENIFKALDAAPSKTIQSALCSAIYNMAQVDFPENWRSAVNEIGERIKQSVGQESLLMSGLLALRQIFQANEYALDEERGPLNQLVDIFFPLLEQVMGDIAQSQSQNQIPIMHLIAKIFFSANNLQVAQYFLVAPQRISPWMAFFQSVLETPLGEQFETPTEVAQQIEELDRQTCWRLKAIVSQITNRLFSKYGVNQQHSVKLLNSS